MTETYAIVEAGGKQYKVAEGSRIDVDYLGVAAGHDVELSRVLLIADGEDTAVGSPVIDGAKVVATCVGERRGDKVIVFKYKPKVRYRVKKGHRQLYTSLKIKEILGPGAPKANKTTRKKAATGGEG